MPSSRGLPDRGTEPRPPALQADSLPSEAPGKMEAKQHHLRGGGGLNVTRESDQHCGLQRNAQTSPKFLSLAS